MSPFLCVQSKLFVQSQTNRTCSSFSLTSAGFMTAADVLELQPTELASELGIPPADALQLVSAVLAAIHHAGKEAGAHA